MTLMNEFFFNIISGHHYLIHGKDLIFFIYISKIKYIVKIY